MKVKDIPDEFELVVDTQELEYIFDFLGKPELIYEYACLFISQTDENDFIEIYAVKYGNNIPYLHLEVEKIFERGEYWNFMLI